MEIEGGQSNRTVEEEHEAPWKRGKRRDGHGGLGIGVTGLGVLGWGTEKTDAMRDREKKGRGFILRLDRVWGVG